MKAVFRDSIYHKNKNKVDLLMVISIDQIYQDGDDFGRFCNLINENKDRINSLTLIETGHLKRHYIKIQQHLPLESAAEIGQELGKAWVKGNQAALDSLEVPYNMIAWQSLVQDEAFGDQLSLTMKDYEQDKVFKKIVDEVGGNYAKKFYLQMKKAEIQASFDECLDAARSYLIEEATIAHQLVKLGDFQVYPGRSNPAVSYAYKKYFGESNPLPWVRYRIIDAKKEKTIKHEVLAPAESNSYRFEAIASNSSHVHSLGIFSYPHEKTRFLQTVAYTLDTLDLTEDQEKVFMKQLSKQFMKQFIQLLVNIQSIKEEQNNDENQPSKVTKSFC